MSLADALIRNKFNMRSILESVRQQIDKSPVSGAQIIIFFIAFLLNVVDGFDVVAMAVTMPSVTADWGISATEKGYILSAALIGMTLGAMYLAPFADKIGRRKTLLIATFIIGTSMIITGFIPPSVELMIAVRAVSGLGIGIIFASSATVASEFAPEKLRNLVVSLVIMGYASGATIVGPVSAWIMADSGWEMVFVYGGLFTLVMMLMIYLFLPESVEYIASHPLEDEDKVRQINCVLRKIKCPEITVQEWSPDLKTGKASVKDLFVESLRLETIGVWVIYFMGFLTMYFLMSWIPTLFVNSGYTRAEGIAALTLFNLGAVLGIVILGLITTKIKMAKPVSAYFVGAAMFLLYVALAKPTAISTLNILIFTIGFLLQGAFVAMYAMAARVYPAKIRATGIGWAAGLGRVGAIISPILVGHLVSASWEMYDLFWLFAIPLVVSGLVVFRYRY